MAPSAGLRRSLCGVVVVSVVLLLLLPSVRRATTSFKSTPSFARGEFQPARFLSPLFRLTSLSPLLPLSPLSPLTPLSDHLIALRLPPRTITPFLAPRSPAADDSSTASRRSAASSRCAPPRCWTRAPSLLRSSARAPPRCSRPPALLAPPRAARSPPRCSRGPANARAPALFTRAAALMRVSSSALLGGCPERVEANAYESLTINYIHGKVPDLVLFDSANREVARYDVSPKTFDEIEKLVQSLGFKHGKIAPPLEEDNDVAIK
ncbi:unnamed protein product [Closterium sp. Naga37s-1]|nr:unnamed protein product [Closterium sp. Naga37s-1]